MGKIRNLILFTILVFVISLIGIVNYSQADDSQTYGDILYKENEDSIQITGIANKSATEIVIPEEINGKLVTSIGTNFTNYEYDETYAVKKITIPATVDDIGSSSEFDFYGPFKNAKNLEEIVVEEKNPIYCSVDGVLYNKDKTELIAYPANKPENTFNIPNTVKILRAFAFACSKNLDEVNIPSSVTTINQQCFMEASIKSLTIPETVEKVETSICEYCPNLTTVEYNASTYVNSNSFYGCTNLTTVTFGDKCTSIREDAFNGCTKLKNVNFETCKLITIKEEAFKGCTSLPRTIKMTETMNTLPKSAFDSDIKIEFKQDMTELKDGWELCADIKVNGTQKYTDAYKVFDLVNEERKKEGLSELKLDKNLMDIAMQRAYEISVYYAHRRPEVYRGFALGDSGHDAQVFIEDTLYRVGLYGKITFNGENIANGYLNSESVMNGWMSSESHKSNILGNYTTMGVGAVKTEYGYFWVQIFGNDTYTPEETREDKEETRFIPVSMGGYINANGPDQGISISLNSNKNTLDVGDTDKIKVTSKFSYSEDTTYIDPSSFNWSSSNNEVLTVDKNGNVKAISAGTANLILTLADGDTISYELTVENSLLKGDVNKDGKVTLYDALKILQQSIIDKDLDDEMLYIMDYNDDGKVELYDALKFLQQSIFEKY